ncbi:MAG: M81 family metallopeptidase [Thermodesulfobacteriota bacterium]
MKVFSAQISHETDRSSPIPTSLDSCREGFLYLPSTGEGAELLEYAKDSDNVGAICLRRGHDVTIGVAADAQPGAPMVKEDYKLLRDELLHNLKAAMPVDFVVLFLHGAMVAHGYDDCEGDILAHIRKIAGPDVPVGVEFDLHGNVTREMVENTTILMACKEYPHTDFGERAVEIVKLLEQTAKGECNPKMAHARVPMCGNFHTTRQPLRGFVDEIMAMEGCDGILSISLTHGFIKADFAGVGSGVLVVTDDDQEKAQHVADTLAQRFFNLREEIKAPGLSHGEALTQALAAPEGPVVIADMTDNPGGGAAGDATQLLEQMLAQGVKDAVIGVIWDPIAVQMATAAGLGTTFPLRVGGKMGPMSGQPMDIEATVTGITDDLWQWAMGERDSFGPAVAVEANGIQIVIGSVRQQVLSPECFTNLNIELESRKLIVVKSAQHFYTTFSELAKKVVYSVLPDASGNQPADKIRFKALHRPLWPLDQPPFTVFEHNWS